MSVPTAPIIDQWPTCLQTSIQFWWRPPTAGAPLTNYTLACSELSYTQDIASDVTNYTVTGLTAGTEYSFTITATNATGTGPAASFPRAAAGLPPFGPVSATVSTINAATALVTWVPSTIANQAPLRWYMITGVPSTVGASTFYKTEYGYRTSTVVQGIGSNTYYRFLVQGVGAPGYCIPFAYTPTVGFGVSDAFSPSSITSMQLWLDAADADTLTTSGGFASQWRDKSGQAYTLTQATSSNQPVYTASTLTFNNNRHFNVPQAAINNTSTYCYFFAFNPISTINWITAKQHDGVNSYNMISMTNYTGPGGLKVAGTSQVLYVHTQNTGTLASSGIAVSTATQQIITMGYDGSTIKIFKNGTQLSETAGTFTIANVTSATNFKMGSWVSLGGAGYIDSGQTNFVMNEFGFYNRALLIEERQKVEGYLAWKWGIQASLPAAHPYKDSGP
jgi:hypothetical protein